MANTPSKIIRMEVQRYKKSGKLVAISGYPGGFMVIELSSDMRSMIKLRNPSYIKRGSLGSTKYQVEVAEKQVGKGESGFIYNYRLVRVLTADDTNLGRWRPDVSLDLLPVSPEDDFTPEERFWAGEQDGNLGCGILLVSISLGAVYGSVLAYQSNDLSYVFLVPIAAIAGWFVFRYPWTVPRRPFLSKLELLKGHKRRLRQCSSERYNAAVTAFEKALENYSNWTLLTPKQFEEAISLRLEREGFNVKTTQYSKDGGIDIEGTDFDGNPVIVQAKQYSSNVGVAVIREMIGIRTSRSDEPRTVVFALAGFTRGAQELADSQDVELRDIRSEVLQL